MLTNANVYLKRQLLNKAAERLDKSKIIRLLESMRNHSDWQHIYQGETVLHLAVKGGSKDLKKEDKVIEILELFLQKRMNVNTMNSAGFTVLQMAILYKMRRVIQFLLKNDARLNYINVHSYFLAHLIIENKYHKINDCDETNSCQENKMCFIDWLLSDKSFKSTTTKIQDKNTPIDVAIKRNTIELLPDLLDNPDQMNEYKNKLTHTFVYRIRGGADDFDSHQDFGTNCDCEERCEVKILKKMIAHGLNIDEADEKGDTALHIVAKYHRSDILKVLLENFKDVNIKNNSGATVMHMLIEHCINHRTMKHKRGVEKFVEILIQKGANVNSDSYEYNPAQLAVMHVHLPILKVLQKYGSDFRVMKYPDGNLLHLIGKKWKGLSGNVEYDEIINLLVSEGCDINAKNENQQTPLHVAVVSGCASIVFGLLKHGACPNLVDRFNCPPLVYAIKQHDVREIEELLKYGADINDTVIYRAVSYLPNYSSALDVIFNHWMKMKAADLPILLKCYESNFDMKSYERLYTSYLDEVQALNEYKITDTISLYDFLKMGWNHRCAYINNKVIKRLIDSSDIAIQYPKYHVIIMASYRDAVARKYLLEKAIDAWNQLTKIILPDICVYRILGHLKNVDLSRMIASVGV